MASNVVAEMVGAASSLLETLDDHQRSIASFAFDDASCRRDWHYVPRERGGLAMSEMSTRQEKRAFHLLSTGLSPHAYAQAATIVALEDVLAENEGMPGRRHRRDYSVSVFGVPGEDTWGWRFEGHHVSINVTVIDREVAPTPFFLGCNPAEIVDGAGAVVVRPLPAEEDLALELVAALTGEQRAEACIGEAAPDDILTTNAPSVGSTVVPEGIAATDLGGDAASLFARLVAVYTSRSSSRAPETLAGLWFAYAGDMRHRRPHYYRVQGERFLAEYDNTQNEANHVHAVWRDPGGDFGDDLLRRHLRLDH